MTSVGNNLISADWATDLVSGFDPGQRLALLIISIGCGLALILGLAGIISSSISSIHRRRAETELKRDLVERGMSADEIATIIETSTSPEDATARWIATWGCKKKTG